MVLTCALILFYFFSLDISRVSSNVLSSTVCQLSDLITWWATLQPQPCRCLTEINYQLCDEWMSHSQSLVAVVLVSSWQRKMQLVRKHYDAIRNSNLIWYFFISTFCRALSIQLDHYVSSPPTDHLFAYCCHLIMFFRQRCTEQWANEDWQTPLDSPSIDK